MGISDKKFFEVDAGEDKNIDVHLIDKDSDEVVDLTAATEITARFKKDDGTLLEKKFSDDEIEILSVAGGKIRVKLLAADTEDLAIEEKQTFEIEALVDSVTTIVKFERSLTVKAPLA